MSDAWTVLDRTELFSAEPYVSIARERVRTVSGAVIDDFYRVELATFALCVPQLASGEIVTLWEYKHGARRLGIISWHVTAGVSPIRWSTISRSPKSACCAPTRSIALWPTASLA